MALAGVDYLLWIKCVRHLSAVARRTTDCPAKLPHRKWPRTEKEQKTEHDQGQTRHPSARGVRTIYAPTDKCDGEQWNELRRALSLAMDREAFAKRVSIPGIAGGDRALRLTRHKLSHGSGERKW